MGARQYPGKRPPHQTLLLHVLEKNSSASRHQQNASPIPYEIRPQECDFAAWLELLEVAGGLGRDDGRAAAARAFEMDGVFGDVGGEFVAAAGAEELPFLRELVHAVERLAVGAYQFSSAA